MARWSQQAASSLRLLALDRRSALSAAYLSRASRHGLHSGGGGQQLSEAGPEVPSTPSMGSFLHSLRVVGLAMLAGACGGLAVQYAYEWKLQSRASPLAVAGESRAVEVAFRSRSPPQSMDLLKALPDLLPSPPPEPGLSDDGKPLTRYAIAIAAAKAAPAVVHLTLSFGRGMFLGQSEGSGAIIHPDGIVLTNAHVVAEAAATGSGRDKGKLVVTMQDGRSFDGEVLSFDTLTDIAVVKIESKTPLPIVKLGSAKSLRPGEWVLAMGSPLHLSNTVTSGIISCVDRKSSELGIRGARNDYLQTDAAINQGNSGGPLVNLDGEVVGINCMKAVAADGVGFAIPIDTAVKVIEQLAKHGRVVRPFVGMRMLELNNVIVPHLRERDPSFPNVSAGVLVLQVVPGSPAARAGMEAGDVVVQFGGEPVTSTRQIFDILGDRVGEEFEVMVKRASEKTVVLKVVTEEASPDL